MFKKIITLFKLGRKVAKSDILNIISKFQEPPLIIKILFKILSISFLSKKTSENSKDEGERLSSTLESMGTTFIKLGQFLATSGSDQIVRLFDYATGQLLQKGVGHSGVISKVAFSPDDRQLVSVGSDGCVFVWNLYA